MSQPIGAIFDMDGVIVHSNPAHEATIKEFCKTHNMDVTDAFLRESVFGRTNKEWIPELFGNINQELLTAYAEEKEAMFRECFNPVKHEVKGATHFLRELVDRSIPCALATSAPGMNADFILDALQIRDCFNAVLDSSHVEKGKPEPEVYIKAAQSLNLPPAQCLVFEDSLAGIEAGRRAGANVIGITSTHTAAELGNCLRTYTDFDEIELDKLIELVNK